MKTSLVWFGAVLVVVGLGACGGKVVVDPGGSSGNGAGGSGGSSSVGPSSVTVSSTGAGAASTASGPGCDCQVACQKLQGCGASLDCGAFCAQVPGDLVECICQAPGCNFDQCGSSSGETSGSSGPTGSGGAGGGLPEGCVECVNQQANGQCAMAEMQCQADPQCMQTVTCMNNCGFTNPCVDMCFNQFGGGSAFFSLVNCTVCGQCFGPCQTSSLMTFCLDG